MQLTVRDVSAMLAVPEETIYRWVDREALPGRRVNGEYRFDRAELLEWAAVRRRGMIPARQPAVSLGSVLSAGGVCSHSDKRAVAEDLTARLQIPGDFDRQALLDLLIAREELGVATIGDGIAAPHPKHPVILPVDHASVTLFYLDPAVKFRPTDAQPVHSLFMCVAPTLRQHLDLLARLAFVLREESLRGALLRRAPQEEVLDQIRRLEAACTAPAERGGRS